MFSFIKDSIPYKIFHFIITIMLIIICISIIVSVYMDMRLIRNKYMDIYLIDNTMLNTKEEFTKRYMTKDTIDNIVDEETQTIFSTFTGEINIDTSLFSTDCIRLSTELIDRASLYFSKEYMKQHSIIGNSTFELSVLDNINPYVCLSFIMNEQSGECNTDYCLVPIARFNSFKRNGIQPNTITLDILKDNFYDAHDISTTQNFYKGLIQSPKDDNYYYTRNWICKADCSYDGSDIYWDIDNIMNFLIHRMGNFYNNSVNWIKNDVFIKNEQMLICIEVISQLCPGLFSSSENWDGGKSKYNKNTNGGFIPFKSGKSYMQFMEFVCTDTNVTEYIKNLVVTQYDEMKSNGANSLYITKYSQLANMLQVVNKMSDDNIINLSDYFTEDGIYAMHGDYSSCIKVTQFIVYPFCCLYNYYMLRLCYEGGS